MIDPVTFRYVPIDERDGGDHNAGDAFKLPVLKVCAAVKIY